MCGIAGIFSSDSQYFNSFASKNISSMTDSLSHRGPDSEGLWIDENNLIALGHRRLSILDLSSKGNQPMHSFCGRYVLVFNGEIYNHIRIRSELQNEVNVIWRGSSDSETLLSGISTWGLEVTLKKIEGMFAFALWDNHTKTLSLARDRIGEKPLYYYQDSSNLFFFSEIKSLKKISNISFEIDRDSFESYTKYGYVPNPKSIYKNVFKLEAASCISFKIENKSIKKCSFFSYWQLNNSVEDSLEIHSSIQDLDKILSGIVQDQMISDVPLGAFLSGGIDSSLIAAIMQKNSNKKINTFTIGFNEDGFNEAPFAKKISDHLGTNHSELYVSSHDALAIIPELPFIYDEPFSDSSQIPSVMLSRFTRKEIKVALSGDGGDELFAGYPRYIYAEKIANFIRKVPNPLKPAIRGALHALSPSSWDIFFKILNQIGINNNFNGRRIYRLIETLQTNNYRELYDCLVSYPDSYNYQNNENVNRSIDDKSHLNFMRKHDLKYFLADDVLVKVDRASMSCGLEVRAPFLNHRLVEYAFALKKSQLINHGIGKSILKKLLSQYVPVTLMERPKAGFSVPIADWLRGPLKKWAESLIRNNIEENNYFSKEVLQKKWIEHQTGKYNHKSFLWNFLMFQAWLDTN
jgi:asparagine synthase (glutamine-hydrolysing)